MKIRLLFMFISYISISSAIYFLISLNISILSQMQYSEVVSHKSKANTWKTIFHISPPGSDNLDCKNLTKEDPDRNFVKQFINWKYPPELDLSDEGLSAKIERNCKAFLKERRYFVNLPDNEEEREFPIAFTIMAFEHASQVERLIRMIFRPWNYYCFHVDRKANNIFYRTINSLSSCLSSQFNNSVNTKKRVRVYWAGLSVLMSDLNCMEELYVRYKKWKYLINLTGQEFPLRTNLELVRILKAFKGANNVDGNYKERHEYRMPTGKVAFPLVWFQGSVHITVNRKFIEFIFENDKAKVMLKLLGGVVFSDEAYFATLNHNPQLKIPGTYIGDPMEDFITHASREQEYFITRLKNWSRWPCSSGRIIRSICIFGVGDLPLLSRSPHLFANKFHEGFQSAAMRCLEKNYYERVTQEVNTEQISIDIDYYSNLPFVINQYQPENNDDK